MRMLRWMVGIKRIEKIRNEDIRAKESVANISEALGEARLIGYIWLGHVEINTQEDM